MSEHALASLLEEQIAAGAIYLGELLLRRVENGIELRHRDDAGREDLKTFQPDEALNIGKFDDAGNYRPLRSAPNLRHGWKTIAGDAADAVRVIDAIYPGRLAIFHAWQQGRLASTSLRDTLNRQSGMYRVAAKISDGQINELVGNFCRSDGGCLRTILWKRDRSGAMPSTKLPPEKFDPSVDQAVAQRRRPATAATVALLCQEPCNLLVAACREVVKRL